MISDDGGARTHNPLISDVKCNQTYHTIMLIYRVLGIESGALPIMLRRRVEDNKGVEPNSVCLYVIRITSMKPILQTDSRHRREDSFILPIFCRAGGSRTHEIPTL